MPPVSKAQNRLMHAAASTAGGADGVPQKVGKEFVMAGIGRKMAGLPERVKKPKKK